MMYNTKIQDWTQEQKTELLVFLNTFDVSYEDVTVKGSRITDDFTTYSDMDINIYSNTIKRNRTILWNDIVLSIHFNAPEMKYQKYAGYDLPEYSIINDVYYEGNANDIITYNTWKHRGDIY